MHLTSKKNALCNLCQTFNKKSVNEKHEVCVCVCLYFNLKSCSSVWPENLSENW